MQALWLNHSGDVCDRAVLGSESLPFQKAYNRSCTNNVARFLKSFQHVLPQTMLSQSVQRFFKSSILPLFLAQACHPTPLHVMSLGPVFQFSSRIPRDASKEK